jgi:Na+/proline symporter
MEAGRFGGRIAISAVVLGTIAVLLTHTLGKHLDILDSFTFWGLGAVVFLLAAFTLGVIFRRASSLNVLFLFVGIALGVIVDAVYQPLVNHESRNLWPLGIAIWFMVGLVPVFVGFVLGRVSGHLLRPVSSERRQ